jgi:hypothetical protein
VSVLYQAPGLMDVRRHRIMAPNVGTWWVWVIRHNSGSFTPDTHRIRDRVFTKISLNYAKKNKSLPASRIETRLISNTTSSLVSIPTYLLLLFSTETLQLSRLIVRSGLQVPTFATRRLHACHHARAPSGGR